MDENLLQDEDELVQQTKMQFPDMDENQIRQDIQKEKSIIGLNQGLKQKYGIGDRQKIIEDAGDVSKNTTGDKIAAFGNILGTSISGDKQNAAGILADAKKSRQADLSTKLGQYDDSIENDPESPQSKIAQELAIQMGMNPEQAKGLTAAKFKTFSPALQKKYELAQTADMKKELLEARAVDADLRRGDQDIRRKELASQRNLAREDRLAKEEERQKQGTASQQGAKGFAKRLQQAEDIFKTNNYDRSSLAAGAGSYLPNVLRSDAAVSNDQAERNFVNAILRKESGASIAPTEFASAEKQYFPRPGDGPETIKNKAKNREIAMKSMISEAGKTWDEPEAASIASASSGYPKKVVNAQGKKAYVQNAAEEEEAMAEGFMSAPSEKSYGSNQ